MVPWAIFDNASCPPAGVAGPCTVPITCATAGAAGLDLDVNGVLADSPVCPASPSTGFLQSGLGGAGDYTIDVFLVDSTGGILSEAHPPSFSVSCADTQTPTVELPVNL